MASTYLNFFPRVCKRLSLFMSSLNLPHAVFMLDIPLLLFVSIRMPVDRLYPLGYFTIKSLNILFSLSFLNLYGA